MRNRIIVFALLLIAIVVGVWRYENDTPDLTQPYAVWEAGKVIAVHNCGVTDNSTSAVACMELNCRSAVAQQLPTPEAATIGIGTMVDSIDIRYVRLVGPIQYSVQLSPKQPIGYECDVEGLRPVRVRILHGK